MDRSCDLGKGEFDFLFLPISECLGVQLWGGPGTGGIVSVIKVVVLT